MNVHQTIVKSSQFGFKLKGKETRKTRQCDEFIRHDEDES